MAQNLGIDPVGHICQNGTVFLLPRGDLVDGLVAYVPPELSLEQSMADAAELGQWYAKTVLPQLRRGTGLFHASGFGASIEFRVERKKFEENPVLATPLLKFFSLARLREFASPPLAKRTYRALEQEQALRASGSVTTMPSIETVGEFLQHCPRGFLIHKMPELGKRGMELLEKVLDSSSLKLQL